AAWGGGQKHRAGIARALAGNPPVILADEPTAALDSQSGRAVMDLMRRLAHEHGRAVAIVTHDSRMLGYADRTVRMEDGRIVADQRSAGSGSLESQIPNPKSLDLAGAVA